MHDRPVERDVTHRQRPIARAVRVDLPIALQAGEPVPARAADRLQVLQAAVPTVARHAAWSATAWLGRREQGAEVLVLGHPVDRLVRAPIVAGDGVRAITPQHGDQLAARDHAMVLA